jgi:hypothetical protein
MRSLPVPVSPVINTVVLLGATSRTCSSTRRMAGLTPMIKSCGNGGRTGENELLRSGADRAGRPPSSPAILLNNSSARPAWRKQPARRKFPADATVGFAGSDRNSRLSLRTREETRDLGILASSAPRSTTTVGHKMSTLTDLANHTRANDGPWPQ